MNTLLIAEVGINHNGSVELAHLMVDAAADAGANAVKFQIHIADMEMVGDLSNHVSTGKNLYNIIESCSLSFDEFKSIKSHCDSRGVKFFATPFSLEAVSWLERLGVDLYKIGSGETSDFLLLDKVSRTGKKMLVSTGMSTIEEVTSAVEFLNLREAKFMLMQCTSEYPAAYGSIHLKMLDEYRSRFGCEVGLSDHAPTIYPALAAVAMGASAVEKHFTIDKGLSGPDQSSSINGQELKELAVGICAIEDSMGSSDKRLVASPAVRQLFMHGLTASRDIAVGESFSADNLTSKRPLIGICTSDFEMVFGKTSAKFIKKDVQIEWNDVNI